MRATAEYTPDIRRAWLIAGLSMLALAGCNNADQGSPPADSYATVSHPHVRSDYTIHCDDRIKDSLIMSCHAQVTGTYRLYEGSYQRPGNKPVDTVVVQDTRGDFVFVPQDTSAPKCTIGYVTLTPTGTSEQYQVYSFDICD